MALVLRKAVLPKNISLLKCIKGRSLATAANVKNPAAISTAVPWRRKWDKTLPTRGYVKIAKEKQLTSVCRQRGRSRVTLARKCTSCPELLPLCRTRAHVAPRRSLTPPRTRPMSHELLSTFMTLSRFCPPSSSGAFTSSSRGYADKPCCAPCCGCGCLPPPCNTPPKCIQYMTGYYYYPYGFWFCGPYHVTGTCAPCGPCCPGGPCGPCGPCPACITPCCKCCACLSSSFSNVCDAPHMAAAVPCAQFTRVQPQFSSPVRAPPAPMMAPSMASRVTAPISSLKLDPRPAPAPAPAPASAPSPAPTMHFKPLAKASPPRPPSPAKSTPSAKKPSRLGISKFLPFQSKNPKQPPPTSCMMTPKGAQMSTFPPHVHTFCTPCVEPIAIKTMKVPKPNTIDPFPKHPKRHISGSFSRCFADCNYRQGSVQPKYSKVTKASGDACPSLHDPRTTLSADQYEAPRCKPAVDLDAALSELTKPLSARRCKTSSRKL
ncbi:uncharacterized protein LOC142985324 isoform X3 [Anticarsia gemmatalis]|uniref:uncharacterized protein LOC142985324 isoform X3 n=1 Tax=Anticarsia gemmatalis TaxID=129554 RepID=UPI003F76C1AF